MSRTIHQCPSCSSWGNTQDSSSVEEIGDVNRGSTHPGVEGPVGARQFRSCPSAGTGPPTSFGQDPRIARFVVGKGPPSSVRLGPFTCWAWSNLTWFEGSLEGAMKDCGRCLCKLLGADSDNAEVWVCDVRPGLDRQRTGPIAPIPSP